MRTRRQLPLTTTVISPLRLQGTPVQYTHAPPTLGEHTDEVLAELGLTPADIAGLRSAKVI